MKNLSTTADLPTYPSTYGNGPEVRGRIDAEAFDEQKIANKARGFSAFAVYLDDVLIGWIETSYDRSGGGSWITTTTLLDGTSTDLALYASQRFTMGWDIETATKSLVEFSASA